MRPALRTAFAIGFCAVFFVFSTVTFAFDDEPNELNWDRLGGSRTSFAHFCAYADARPEFFAKLIAETPKNARPTAHGNRVASVWVAPEAFEARLGGGWGFETVADRRVLSYYAGHGGGATRAVVTIPKSGYYRVWAEYYHEQGTTASFVLRLEDPKVVELTGEGQTVVQDVESWRFDFAEMGRRGDLLPNRREEPTGFLWEETPCVWLEKGERALTVAGMMHDGPFAPRRIASIAITEEPIAIPTPPEDWNAQNEPITVRRAAPSAEARRRAALWRRRPAVGETNARLIALWQEWRDAFFAELAEYKVEGIEGRRMASEAAFDPSSNLIGTPRQIRDGKETARAFLDGFPKDSYFRKIEGEEFTPIEGWGVEGSSDASGGKILVASYGDGLARARYEFDAPKSGVYSLWSRYLELPGYLSEFKLQVEASDGTVEETVFCANEEENKTSPGFRWRELKVKLDKGKTTFTLSKEYGPGLTYRRYDCLVVTDSADWRPEGQGELVAPFDHGGLVLWNADPWSGFTRFSAPKSDDVLTPTSKPTEITLPYGAVVSASLLVRNESDRAQTFRPQIVGDGAGLLSWRLQAFTFTPQFGWTPHPLLERTEVTVPAGETAGIWLTFNGDIKSANESAAVRIGDQTARYKIVRKGDLRSAPVPYVGGWSFPYELVSCWETFKRLGVNTLNGGIIPAKDAKKYGIKLFVKLNDADVSEEHIAAVKRSFQEYGYKYGDWAWSFMDEPGAGASDAWVELAKQFKARAPEIRIWCNPGEMAGAPPESDLKMTPYVDCYCPSADHYWQRGGGNEAYWKELSGEGRKFALRLTYTTPCFGEKAPGAPNDMFGPMDASIKNGLDGWMFYVLMGRYEYCNSLWDEVNAYVPDQAVSLYPGAGRRTISTRTAEAIRAAVDRWRAARLEEQAQKQTN